MSKIALVKGAVDEQLDNCYDLLAMRLLFPPEFPKVSIADEITDLYTYPERLNTGYRDEWRAIATRALYKNAFCDHWRSDQDNLQRYLKHLRSDAIPRCVHEHIELFRKLGQIQAISQAPNTLAFPDPQRRALMNLIWPEQDPS